MTRIMVGSRLLLTVCALSFLAIGCMDSKRGTGVTPPKEELRDPNDKGVLDREDSIKNGIKNLTFEKPNRTLKAAKMLGDIGSEAVTAVPYLKEYIAMETNSDGFPSDEQRAAFKEALQRIEDDAKAKGVPIPTEKSDITTSVAKKQIEAAKKASSPEKK